MPIGSPERIVTCSGDLQAAQVDMLALLLVGTRDHVALPLTGCTGSDYPQIPRKDPRPSTNGVVLCTLACTVSTGNPHFITVSRPLVCVCWCRKQCKQALRCRSEALLPPRACRCAYSTVDDNCMHPGYCRPRKQPQKPRLANAHCRWFWTPHRL